jgi:hypothetical protein
MSYADNKHEDKAAGGPAMFTFYSLILLDNLQIYIQKLRLQSFRFEE